MHPERPRIYRIRVEEADGTTHDHGLVAGSRELVIGDVLEQGADGWPGPRVSIEEIDRHPDANQDGAALAWQLPKVFQAPAKPVTPARGR